jgi:hypothetical protein
MTLLPLFAAARHVGYRRRFAGQQYDAVIATDVIKRASKTTSPSFG